MRPKDLSGAALKNKKKRDAKGKHVEEQTTATMTVSLLLEILRFHTSCSLSCFFSLGWKVQGAQYCLECWRKGKSDLFFI